MIEDATSQALFGELRRVTVFGTTASRRMVLVLEDATKGSDIYPSTCAEPPPDVGEAFAAALAGGLRSAVDASEGNTNVGAELAGQFARQRSTEIAPLLFRTQGLQIYRDVQFGLCIDKINGDIESDDAYLRLKQDRFDQTVSLIREELPLMKEVLTSYYQSVRAGRAEVNVDDMVKLLNAAKPEPTVRPGGE